jgi:hypothetical protein
LRAPARFDYGGGDLLMFAIRCLAILVSAGLLGAAPIATPGARAAQGKPTVQAKPNEPAKPAQQLKPDSPPPAQIMVPDSDGLIILIANTIIAVSQANLTGNYSVLRDLGAPDFQKANSLQRLAAIFADLRGRSLNFGPVVLFRPKLVRPAAIDEAGLLRMTGFYDTQPLQVHFDLAFQPVAGSWRLFEISVWTAVLR